MQIPRVMKSVIAAMTGVVLAMVLGSVVAPVHETGVYAAGAAIDRITGVGRVSDDKRRARASVQGRGSPARVPGLTCWNRPLGQTPTRP